MSVDPELEHAMEEAVKAEEAAEKAVPEMPAGMEPEIIAATVDDGPEAAPEPDEAALLKDQLLRTAAEFENYRKRTRREADDLRQYGIERLAGDLLPVLDNFDRALEHAPSEPDPILEGIRMVAKQLTDAMASHGVVSFDASGVVFDPALHEAVGRSPSPDHDADHIMAQLEPGYRLHQRLLRPAKVIVSTGAPAPVPESTDA